MGLVREGSSEEERLRESLEGRGELNREEGESGKAGGCTEKRAGSGLLFHQESLQEGLPGLGAGVGLERGAPSTRSSTERQPQRRHLGWQPLVKPST